MLCFIVIENYTKFTIDEIRDESSSVIQDLKKSGFAIQMLTGDSYAAAKEVCEKVGIDDGACRARLLPADKLEWIRSAQAEARPQRVCMVGDGINDAAALAGVTIMK
jgi:P-type E1-E2 ATPase